MRYTFISGLIGAAVLAAGVPAAFGQTGNSQTVATGAPSATSGDELTEVIITAEKRSEDLQKTAVSITAISGADLLQSGQATGSTFLPEALQNVAGLEVSGGQNGNITMRGVAPVGADQQGFAPATATYVDGVFSPFGGGSLYGATGGNLDTQRLEVLRGPQGTLFGLSATGGVLNILTNDPVLGKYEASGTMELGDFELRHFGAALNVPLGEGLAFRASADSEDRDGFLSTGQGDEHQRQMRLKILYQGGPISAMLAGYYETFGGGYGGGTVPIFCTPIRPDCTIPQYKGDYVSNTPQASVVYNPPSTFWRLYGRIEADLGFADLTLIPSYDSQFVPSTNSAGIPYTSIGNTPYQQSYFEEGRLSSKAESKLIWVVGVNYYHVATAANTSFYLSPNNPPTNPTANLIPLQLTDTINRTGSVGEFAQVTYPITDSFRVTGGLRYTHEIIHIATQNFASQLAPVPFTTTLDGVFDSWNYTARLEKDLGQNHLLYADVSTGFTPGGLPVYNCAAYGPGANQCPVITNPAVNPQVTRSFPAEKVTAYEIGSKNELFNRRLQLNASVYYYAWPHLQSAAVLFNAAGVSPIGELITDNPATIRGFELESVWLATPYDRITFSPTWLDAHYTSLNPVTSQLLFGGTQLAYSPHLQLAGRIDHTFRLPGGYTLTLSPDAVYRSNQFIHQSLEPVAYQPAYTIVDCTLSFASAEGKYHVDAYIRNLAGAYYKVGAQLPGPETPSTGDSMAVGVPRRYGVIVSAHF